MEDLIRWKASEERKPMVLKGARQVGKTWLMKEFGKNYYTSYVYFNFDEEDDLKSIFETSELPRLKEVGANGINQFGLNTGLVFLLLKKRKVPLLE